MVRKSKSRIVFEIFNYTLFTIFCISIVLPFINVIAISLSSKEAVIKGEIGLLPVGFNLNAYNTIVNNSQFIRTVFNTTFLAVINVSTVILVSLAAGYALTSKYLVGRKIVFIFIMIPMYFSGGLIPSYVLINQLGLGNTYWALILPKFVSIFYIIVFRNIINQLPKEMVESAEIDGATQPQVLYNIIIPLIIPTIAAFVVFQAVAEWNSWFGCMLYIRNRKMWTLQYQLRDILVNAEMANPELKKELAVSKSLQHPQNLKMAALMVTILPIIAVYPFVQKYFMSGVIVGAVKG